MEDDQRLNTLVHEGDTLYLSLQHCKMTANRILLKLVLGNNMIIVIIVIFSVMIIKSSGYFVIVIIENHDNHDYRDN